MQVDALGDLFRYRTEFSGSIILQPPLPVGLYTVHQVDTVHLQPGTTVQLAYFGTVSEQLFCIRYSHTWLRFSCMSFRNSITC